MGEPGSSTDVLARSLAKSKWPAGYMPSGDPHRGIGDLVEEYGLTLLELKIYIGLLRCGSSTAKDLTTELGMNRVEVYRILNRLKARDLVTSSLGTPMVYQPVRPSTAIRSMLQDFESKARRMKESAPEIIMELETLERVAKPRRRPMDGGFRVVTGGATWDTVREMFERSQHSVQGIWSLRRVKEAGLIRPFMHSVKDGVRAQIICQVTKRNIPEVKELMRVAAVRHFDGAERGLRFTIVDGRELSLGASTADVSLDASASICSDNQALIQTLTTTFQTLWKKSIGADEKIAEFCPDSVGAIRDSSRPEARYATESSSEGT